VDNIKIEGTGHAPEVILDFQNHSFSLRGMSYLEDVKSFYTPILEQLEAHMSALDGADITFTVDLNYLNSSSARIMLRLFDLMDATAERGNVVSVVWRHADDDDSMEEQGEEFGEDLVHADFKLEAFKA